MIRPLILLLGASGSGKSSVAIELEKRYGLKQMRSYTTREPRFDGEPGHEFIDYQTFLELMMDHKLVASTEINGFFYGATKEMVDACDIYVIDPRGAIELHDLYDSMRPIFYVYLDVSPDERARRMAQRGTESEAEERKDADAVIADQAHAAGSLYKNALYVENTDFESCVRIIAEFIGLKE